MQQVIVPTMWTLDQAAIETGLTKFTIREILKAGHVRFIRVGVGQRGKILVNAESLCDYMQGVSE